MEKCSAARRRERERDREESKHYFHENVAETVLHILPAPDVRPRRFHGSVLNRLPSLMCMRTYHMHIVTFGLSFSPLPLHRRSPTFIPTNAYNLSASSIQVYSESVNHSRLQPADTAAVVIGDEAMEKGAVYADVAEGGMMRVT